MIQSPLNYTGGKFKLLPQILPIFPKEINTFVDTHLTKSENRLKLHVVVISPDHLLEELHNPRKNTLAEIVYLRDLYYFERNFKEIKRIIEG